MLPPDSLWQHITVALHRSLWRVAQLLVSLLPGVLALVLAVALFTVFGAVLAYVVRAVLTAVHFDERLKQTAGADLADWSPKRSPTALAARIAFFTCLLLGLVVGVSALDVSYSTGTALTLSLMPYLTHAIGAILILIAGNMLARFLARGVLLAAVQRRLLHARLLSKATKWMVVVIASAMALENLRIGGAIVELAFAILFGGITLTLALAIGLGARDYVARTLDAAELPLAQRRAAETDEPPPLQHF